MALDPGSANIMATESKTNNAEPASTVENLLTMESSLSPAIVLSSKSRVNEFRHPTPAKASSRRNAALVLSPARPIFSSLQRKRTSGLLFDSRERTCRPDVMPLN
jgi:hypothetical protein